MSLIPEGEIDKVRSSTEIATIIGEKIPLKKTGRHLKALCPFHTEKTPSFLVNPERQIYHCFGCGEGGNVFTFLMKYEGIGFAEAVERLAERAGITLTRKGGGDEAIRREEKERFFQVNRIAARFYYDRLVQSPEGGKGRDYLKRRAIRPEMIREALLGYAPGGKALVRHLEEKKIPLGIAEKLGLIRLGETGDHYDFFRDRLLFTILSADKKILGFTGRSLEEGQEPKYLNSPDSTVYNKGESLLGLHLARGAVREADQVVVVEGNFDQLRLVQEGIRQTVAPLGTALTTRQIQLLARWTRNFVLIFDGDPAGLRAADRALTVFLPLGIFPRVVLLPLGEDPDTYVGKFGGDTLRSQISVAGSLLDSYLDRVLREGGATPEGQGQAVRSAVEVLVLLQGDVEKRLYIQKVAERVGLPEEVILRQLSTRTGGMRRDSNFPPAQGDDRGAGRDGVGKLPALEKTLVEILLTGLVPPELLFEEIATGEFRHPDLGRIWETLREGFGKTKAIDIAGLLDRLPEGRVREILTELTVSAARWESEAADLRKVVADLVRQIRRSRMKIELQGLTRQIREAEKTQEGARLKELLDRKSEILRQVKTVH